MAEPAWVRIQRKTFTRWCNNFLIARNLSINVMEEDLQDGVLLHNLLELLSNEKIHPAAKKNAKIKLQKVGNLNTCLNYIRSKDIKLVGIGAEDIHDGKSTLILGLIWTLILRFQITGEYDDPGASAKQALLDWCNSVLNPQGLSVTNFKDSWQDGRAFCGLVNALQPNQIPLNTVNPANAEENLNRAFDTAEELFQFPKVLDAPDVIETPDELSIMTYVSYYRAYLQANTAHAPNCYAEGPGLTNATTFKPAQFTVHAVNEEGVKATRGGAPVRAFLKDPSGADVCKVVMVDNRNGTYTATYVSPAAGKFELQVLVGQNQIKDSPFRPNVEPGEPEPGKCVAFGPGLESAVAGVPTGFTVQTKDSAGNNLPNGGTKIEAHLKDPSGDIPVQIVDNGDGTYSASYTPRSAGDVKLSVVVSTENYGKGPIQNSPFTVSVQPGKPSAANTVASGPGTKGAKAGEPAPIHVQTRDAFGNNLNSGGAPIAAKVTHNKTGAELSPAVFDNNDGTYTLNYTPESAGNYTINVYLGDENIKDMPIEVKVTPGSPDTQNFDWDGLDLDSNGNRIVVAGETDKFSVQAKDSYGNPVKQGGINLKGKVSGSDKVPVNVVDNNNGSYELNYTPVKVGNYTLEVSADGKPIGGGKKNPFPFIVIPAGPSSANSIAYGSGVEKAQVGGVNQFTVEVRDKFDNKLTMGGADVGGQLQAPGVAPVPIEVEDLGDGTYSCSYPGVKKAGTYELVPTVGGHPVKGAPFKIKVSPGNTSIDNTTVEIPDKNVGGRPGPIVSLYDDQKNRKDKGGDKIRAEIKRKSRLKPLPAKDNGDGTYHIDYPPHLRGQYEVVVEVNDKAAPGGPWNVDVEGNTLDDEDQQEVEELLPEISGAFGRLLSNATPKERKKLLSEIRSLSKN